MRSDSDSQHSEPASQDWSAGSEGEDGGTSPAALAAGPPGWTWCLEPSDSTGAADDWGSDGERSEGRCSSLGSGGMRKGSG